MRENPTAPWWQDALIYQIYPRSFQDSNGDGIGDLPGIVSRLDELAKLGVDALWLSPIYPSPDVDNGYDIADYCAVDPKYGSLADFDALVAAAAARGIKIILDLVINHTSDQHPWFQASRGGDPTYADYYIWQPATVDAKGHRQPPNNWTSFFMGPVWQWDERRQAYYLHLFDKAQPDLNYRCPAVIEEIKAILTFWLDHGVAGFRCDVINVLWKDSLADGASRWPIIRGIEHYASTEGTHRILRELRRDVLGPRQAFTVGETVAVNLPQARDLTDPSRGELDTVFTFDHLEVDRLAFRYGPKPFSARELLARLTRWQTGLDQPTAVLENHDQPRIVSHYGDDGRYWRRSAMLLATWLLTLRGTAFIYQGQEIGMTNGDFATLADLDDVESHSLDGLLAKAHLPARLRWALIRPGSRDNARTPMQWDDSEAAGFTSGTPWLKVNANKDWINYATQDQDRSSVLNYYRRLIALRASSETLRRGGFEPVEASQAVMVYRRRPPAGSDDGVYTVWLNFSGRVQPLGQAWPVVDGVLMASNIGRANPRGLLAPWAALVVRSPGSAAIRP